MINIDKFLNITIDEASLLSDIDDMIETGDKEVDLLRAEGWAKNARRKVWMARQKKGYAFYGDFVIDDIDEKEYTGTPIKRITGSLSISGCNIENLNGIFLPDCEIDGSLTIEDCPNLISLEGGPRSCKNLTISGCKKLKNLHTRTVVSGNLFLHNNGKKFKEEDIRKDDKNIYVIKNIFCSEESNDPIINESETINEAFAAPQLKILADALNKKHDPFGNDKLNLKHFMADVELDKVKSSQVHVYDLTDDDDCVNAIRDAKLLFQMKRSGFMYTIDYSGEVKYLIIGKRVLDLDYVISNYDRGSDTRVYAIERMIRSCSTLIIVDVTGMRPGYEIRGERRDNQKDAIALKRGKERSGKITGKSWLDTYSKIDEKNIRYFQDIADQNRERYKNMLAKIKAERVAKSNNFDKFKNQIDKLFQRYTALLSKILKDPSKYNSYEIEFIHDRFNNASIGGHGKYRYIAKTGLFNAIENYMGLIINSSKGTLTSYERSNFENKIKEYEEYLQTNIDIVDKKILAIENK